MYKCISEYLQYFQKHFLSSIFELKKNKEYKIRHIAEEDVKNPNQMEGAESDPKLFYLVKGIFLAYFLNV